MKARVAVKFLNAWGIYRAGEVAGFEPGKADTLINKLKVAKLLTPVVVEPVKEIVKVEAVVVETKKELEPIVELTITEAPVSSRNRKPSWMKK